MYISVDDYREMYLSGRDASSVLEEIEKIRREISKVKAKLESPANVYEGNDYNSGSSQIEVFKGYISAARDYVFSLTGEPCDLSEEEKASLLFDSMVDDIECLTLTVGRYLQDKYELSFKETGAEICEMHLEKDSVCRSVDSSSARECVRSMHIGDWKDTYTPEQYGCTLNEPTKWQLRIDYKRGHAPRFYDGFGIFPYNFDVLARLLGADIA